MKSKEDAKTNDTNKIEIGRRNITDEIAGSAYRLRATRYFFVYENDTSSFRPIFSESNSDSTVTLRLDLPYGSHGILYANIHTQLELILKEASNDYSIKALKHIGIGRLIQTGDLAVQLSHLYAQSNNAKYLSTSNYSDICQFLESSPLAHDFNELLMPYEMEVSAISIEKAFFTSKEVLLHAAKLETDTANIPEQILDCNCWIELKATN